MSEPRVALQNPHPFLKNRKGGLQKVARKAQVVTGFRAYLIRFDTK